MLNWALLFLIVALVAGVFGFAGLAVAAAGIAKFISAIFADRVGAASVRFLMLCKPRNGFRGSTLTLSRGESHETFYNRMPWSVDGGDVRSTRSSAFFV
jgi:uncharacterized membrane protein YtjA (UPF0391 family)